jgi:hypothetical protein
VPWPLWYWGLSRVARAWLGAEEIGVAAERVARRVDRRAVGWNMVRCEVGLESFVV